MIGMNLSIIIGAMVGGILFPRINDIYNIVPININENWNEPIETGIGAAIGLLIVTIILKILKKDDQ